MKFYLKHPKHGRKIAYLEEEAEADKKNGWEEYDPDEVQNVVRKEEIEEPEAEKEVNGYLDMDELKATLDALEIPYRKNASRETLTNLLEEANGRTNTD